MDKTPSQSVDEYISVFPEDVRKILETIRLRIKNLAPEAQETISYGIPTFKFAGNNLVHYAAYKGYIGFYPTSSGISNFINEMAAYKTSKGTVQFPLDKPIPYDLIDKITLFRIEENLKINKQAS